jgi:hypothetical protein
VLEYVVITLAPGRVLATLPPDPVEQHAQEPVPLPEGHPPPRAAERPQLHVPRRGQHRSGQGSILRS